MFWERFAGKVLYCLLLKLQSSHLDLSWEGALRSFLKIHKKIPVIKSLFCWPAVFTTKGFSYEFCEIFRASILQRTCEGLNLALRKITEFHIISWCGNFVERHSSRIVSGNSVETLRKLCPFTKTSTPQI